MKRRGRLLKVKYGYNPNSSSIGTHVNAFLLGAAVFALALNSLAIVTISLRAKLDLKIENPKKEKKPERL